MNIAVATPPLNEHEIAVLIEAFWQPNLPITESPDGPITDRPVNLIYQVFPEYIDAASVEARKHADCDLTPMPVFVLSFENEVPRFTLLAGHNHLASTECKTPVTAIVVASSERDGQRYDDLVHCKIQPNPESPDNHAVLYATDKGMIDILTHATRKPGAMLPVSFKSYSNTQTRLCLRPARHGQEPALWISQEIINGLLSASYYSTDPTTLCRFPL